MTAVDTHLLLRAFVDELARCDVTTAVTAPGSRNTPIIEALVADPRIRAHSVIDERAAGFFALGAAKAAGRPVVVTATSGTAVANLLPAVIEAHQARVPLIVLSADRPAELRQTGAGQTIDQVKIFGDAVRWFFEPDMYEASAARMRWVRALACRACFAATAGTGTGTWTGGAPAGPVQINIPLREPLVVEHPLPPDPPGGEGRPDGAPWVRLTHAAGPPSPGTAQPVDAEPLRPPPLGRAVIVAGELDPADPTLGASLSALADRAGLPLLADPLSGARRGASAIAHYDLILREPAALTQLQPDLVLRFGELPTSKPLRAWLESLDQSVQTGFARDASWSDPAARLSARTVGPLAALIAQLEADLPTTPAPPEWLARWRAADTRAAAAIKLHLQQLNEPSVAALLGAELPAEATLLVAASMPIRDIEEFVAVRADPPRMLANRGANGIDGTVSTAFGAATQSDGPVVLLIGDVALAHDIGGLLAARRTGTKLTVVLINNDGGGIFNFLSIAGHDDVFSDHIATTHGLDFRHAAALYGFEYVTPTDLGGLKAALNSALQGRASTLIEVHTERTANRRLHAEIEQAARTALGAAVSPPAPATAPAA